MILPRWEQVLVLSFVPALVSAYLAHRRGQNPYLWFFAGFLFGFLGVAAFFYDPFPKAKAPAQPPPEPYISGPSNIFWYYLDDTHKQHGPISYQGLTNEWKQQNISPATLVWNESLSDWTKLEKLIRFKN